MEIPVTRPSMPEMEEYIEEIKPIWESRWLTNMGEKHEELTKQLASYLKVPNLSLMVNGHMSLEMVLQAFHLTGEVITTPFTFASTTHAIVRNGLSPVFCDIRETDFTMDPEKIEGLITEKTSAIVPVHVYGNLCDVERIEEIGKKHGLKVIYDAAHAFGVEKDGKGAGVFGDASVFSFHATKVFHTIEGGAVAFQDEKIGESLYHLKNFGIMGEGIVEDVGANAKMNEFCAAMGICNLRHIDREIEKRGRAAAHYRKRLEQAAGITLKVQQEGVKENYAYFPILIEEEAFGKSRDRLYGELREQGIYSRKYFYPLTSDFDCYRGQFLSSETPVAKEIAEKVLVLPLWAGMPLELIDRICDIILSK